MAAKDDMATNKSRPRASKGYKGMAMEGFIARWYAKTTQKDIEEFKSLAGRLAETLVPGRMILEIAPGPGYLSIELARRGNCEITGLDISKSFVEMAQQKAKEAGVSVNFQHGNASQMPFDAETFDFIVCRAAFKNFSEPVQALQEMQRVLKSGGKALIIDLRRDVSPEVVNNYVDTLGLNWIDSLMTKWTFKYMLIGRAYTKAEIREFVAQTKFRTCDIQETSIGMEIWLGR